MKLLEWLGNQLNTLQYEIIDVEDSQDGNVKEIILHIASDIIDPVKSTPTPVGKRGHHIHDSYEIHPVATRHPITAQEPPLNSSAPSMYANNPDNVMDCDGPKCDSGKYQLMNGTYNICYRCDGKGWINASKHDRNLEYDKKKKGFM